MRILLVPALVLSLTIPTYAWQQPGNLLLQQCETAYGSALSGVCVGYVVGVVDATYQFEIFCLPSPSVTNQQLVDLVTQHLTANPQTRHMEASGLVVEALQHAFPC